MYAGIEDETKIAGIVGRDCRKFDGTERSVGHLVLFEYVKKTDEYNYSYGLR